MKYSLNMLRLEKSKTQVTREAEGVFCVSILTKHQEHPPQPVLSIKVAREICRKLKIQREGHKTEAETRYRSCQDLLCQEEYHNNSEHTQSLSNYPIILQLLWCLLMQCDGLAHPSTQKGLVNNRITSSKFSVKTSAKDGCIPVR